MTPTTEPEAKPDLETAGPALDAWIATNIEQWEPGLDGKYPKYSRRVEDAWVVVERMAKIGWRCQIVHYPKDSPKIGCQFIKGMDGEPFAMAFEDSMPLAVALAAKRALEAQG